MLHRNRLNRSLLHKARHAAHTLFEQEQKKSHASDETDSESFEHVNLSHAIERIRNATANTDFDGKLWIVGGYVRDTLLGMPIESLDDADLVTELDAITLAAKLYADQISEIAPVIYPRFGTAMLRVSGCDIELVTARRESYSKNSRKPSNIEAATLAEDALRRDFTVNALLENLHTGERLDPTGHGLDDLSHKILQTPLPPDSTFADDPLRMLRAVRFACKLNFHIETKTWEGIIANAGNLLPPKVSSERIRDEFCKTLMCSKPSRGLELLRKSGLLTQFAPELTDMVGVVQNEFHRLPVWDHTLLALDNLVTELPNSDIILRLGTLFHDVGKPATKSIGEDGRIHFYAHEDIGAKIAEIVLKRLKFSSSDIDKVVQLVALHMRIGEYRPTEWTDAAVRRLVRDTSDQILNLFALHTADVSALANDHQDMTRSEQLRLRIGLLEANQPSIAIVSPLSGEEIIEALGIAPGPDIGKWKQWLTDEVIEGRLQPGDKDAAIIAMKAASFYRLD